jgi:hypothetical protein
MVGFFFSQLDCVVGLRPPRKDGGKVIASAAKQSIVLQLWWCLWLRFSTGKKQGINDQERGTDGNRRIRDIE